MQASQTQGIDTLSGSNSAQSSEFGGRRERFTDADVFLSIDGERVYRINRFDSMSPFLMSLVSDADLWLYCSSYGPVTAGRIDEEHCLFPYVTDDVLHRCIGQAGPITILRVECDGLPPTNWEPFARFPAAEQVERSIYKSVLSNIIVFEENHHGLGLTFRYRWTSSDDFGFVRTATLENFSDGQVAHVDVIDGLVNILPAGAGLATQQRYSCLIDAYTRCEIVPECGVALFALTSRIIDRPEPAESLSANIVWSRGLPHPIHLLSIDQVPSFARGCRIEPELLLTGRRGSFLVSSTLSIEPGERVSWDVVADVGRDQAQVEELCATLRNYATPVHMVRASTKASRDALTQFVAQADGLQCSADERATSHHAACTLFNIMRGGVFADSYRVACEDFREFVASQNRTVARDHAAFLDSLPEAIGYLALLSAAAQQSDSQDLVRLAYEYLPLTFSRRHGDPSRPWNRFAIQVKAADGSRILNYQGNWRDIFQNWEALCFSFPSFIESTIAKFVNASTVDGYNPVRISRDGIDWETPDPEDPWSNIGYWGDHQIVYLLKLLELSHKTHPHILEDLLAEPIFTYANVPYRIKPYARIVEDSRNTIVYDTVLAALIEERVGQIGGDGKLLQDSSGGILHATLAEKLMVAILSKLSNFIPGAGIWMNTQRPEWNDANNALVGNGVSMVTLCYLRRHLAFCRDLFAARIETAIDFSADVAIWLTGIADVLSSNEDMLASPEVTAADRRTLMDDLGGIYCGYRDKAYDGALHGTLAVSMESCVELCDLAIHWMDHTISANRRADSMYHSYNLLDLAVSGEARIERLPVMLEGQVAALSTGIVAPGDAAALLESLYASELYRANQDSFLLYPARELHGFLDKNIVSPQTVKDGPLLSRLVSEGDRTILIRDARGHFRFNSQFRNSLDLSAAFDRLAAKRDWSEVVESNKIALLAIYENVFGHGAFTGRSGAMYGYEGLGCVYWHMVSKLALAVQECHARSHQLGDDSTARLARLYYRIREGLGFNKTALQYGAFPPDPYSHTPAHAGARQPGMTGQSKEDILTRFGELGVHANDGQLIFRPTLLRRGEFLTEPASWDYVNLAGKPQKVKLGAGTMAFTICQVPVIYRLVRGPGRVSLLYAGGSRAGFAGDALDRTASSEVFLRTSRIVRIEVDVSGELITLA